MKIKAIMLAALIALIATTGCTEDAEETGYFSSVYEDLIEYNTDLEYYAALYAADKGSFLTTCVDNDVTLRFKCAQFFEQVNLKQVEQLTEDTCKVNTAYQVTIVTENQIIKNFEIRKDSKE